VNHLGCDATAALLARYAFVLWTGTAAALQSPAYGNMGPVGSWNKVRTFPTLEECAAGRAAEVKVALESDPTAVKRQEDLIASKKTLPGDEEMVVHSVTKFLCLPEGIDPSTHGTHEGRP
jgi:hypothetical protein